MPDIRLAPSGDVSIAYHVVGEGPIDIIYAQGAWTHLQASWELPAYRRFCERIGEFARFVRFDKRGMGMSDRVPGATTLETRMDDIRAVMDAIESDQAAIIGESEGGPLALLFAAAYPERTRALVLQGAEVREQIADDWPWGEASEAGFEEKMARLPTTWSEGPDVLRFIPSLRDPEPVRRWWRSVFQSAGTPASLEAFFRMAWDIDVRDVAPVVDVPTLIFHAVDDAVCSVGNARFLAEAISGARYVEHDGGDHLPWFKDAEPFIAELREFLTGERPPARPQRYLASVLFTDIVGSTAAAASVGDTAWRRTLLAHYDSIRRALRATAGTEIDMPGDGVFATFAGPARAIECGQAIIEDANAMGLSVRAGVHVGEVEQVDDGVAGIAVHIGSRIASTAAADEVLVSSIVTDLVAGSGLTFADRGEHQLKGVPRPMRLYAVERARTPAAA